MLCVFKETPMKFSDIYDKVLANVKPHVTTMSDHKVRYIS